MSTMDVKQLESETTKRIRRPYRSSAETREHVLEVAYELFYWEGIHATGVDRLAEEAGVASTTLYRLFGSKDELVRSYVDMCGAGYRDRLTAAAAPTVGSARDRILSIFDAIASMIAPDTCRGCPFLMALGEFPDAHSRIHSTAVDVKVWVRELLRGLTADLDAEVGLTDSVALADQLALLIEGIYASLQALSSEGPARQARAAAEALMTAAESAT